MGAISRRFARHLSGTHVRAGTQAGMALTEYVLIALMLTGGVGVLLGLRLNGEANLLTELAHGFEALLAAVTLALSIP